MKNIKLISVISILLCAVMLFASCKGNNGGTTTDKPDGGTAAPVLSTGEDTAAPVKEPEGGSDGRISVLAVGDNLVHECVYLDAMSRATAAAATVDSRYAKYFFSEMYTGVAPMISAADLAFVNLEGPMNPDASPSGYPSFNAPAEAGETLVDLGFDIVNLANNHMLDRGSTGCLATIDYWAKKPVTTVGGYKSADDYNDLRIIEKNGIKLAVLSFTYGVNSSASATGLYIPIISDGEITRQIADAKTKSDFVIVSMHWGSENTFTPTTEQKRLAQLIADCGAGVILGHHSHTIQPVEWLTGKSGNTTLCYYSLGNFISTMLNSYNMVGGLASFDIVMEEGGAAHVENPVLTPTVCHYTCDKTKKDSQDLFMRQNLQIYKLSDYTEELCSVHGSQNWGAFTLEKLTGYATDTIKNEFLPPEMKK